MEQKTLVVVCTDPETGADIAFRRTLYKDRLGYTCVKDTELLTDARYNPADEDSVRGLIPIPPIDLDVEKRYNRNRAMQLNKQRDGK